jgi:hypothetical protein
MEQLADCVNVPPVDMEDLDRLFYRPPRDIACAKLQEWVLYLGLYPHDVDR